jgi:hypothetical protein
MSCRVPYVADDKLPTTQQESAPIHAVRYATTSTQGSVDGASGLVSGSRGKCKLPLTANHFVRYTPESALCVHLYTQISLAKSKAVRSHALTASRPNGLSRSECTVAIWSPSSARTVDVTTSTVHGCTVLWPPRPVARVNVPPLGKSGSQTPTCQQ